MAAEPGGDDLEVAEVLDRLDRAGDRAVAARCDPAQELRPDAFVLVAGYGECGPGYIPVERAWRESDGNLADWCWVNPGSEGRMTGALRAALRAG